MEQARNLGNFALWLSSHLLFTLILDMAIIGGYQTFQWYQADHKEIFDASQYDDNSLNDMSVEIFKEQKLRGK